jgi:CO dehydrogenase/acetyl-CoA synthase beta subunit
LELADLRKPGGAGCHRVVLIYMPEAKVIGRIDSEHGIIAPAPTGMGLVTAAGGHDSFALAEII